MPDVDYGKIQGTILSDGDPVAREVIAVSYAPVDTGEVDVNDDPIFARVVVGESASIAEDGTYILECPGFFDETIVVALPDHGAEWKPNRTYSVGDRIRPTVGNETGFVYECTIGGVSDPDEPTWWSGGNEETGEIGTATFKAVPSWWPVAHAPIKPTYVSVSVTLYPLELDPYFNNVVSLRHFDVDGVDVISGNSWDPDPAVATGQIKFGTASQYFNGSSNFDRIYDDVFLDLTEPFTIETWIHPELNSDYQVIFSIGDSNNNNNRFMFYIRGGGVLYTYAQDSAVRVSLGTVDAPVAVDTWHHVALSSDGTTVYMHLNGIFVGSQAWSSRPYIPNQNLFRWGVGWLNSAHRYYKGYMDDQRITLGTCRYVDADFTLPEEAYPDTRFAVGREPTILDPHFDKLFALTHLEGDTGAQITTDVTGQSWVFSGQAQLSATEAEHGTTSVALDGNGDYLTIGTNADWKFITDGSTDWTVEVSIFMNSAEQNVVIDNGGGQSEQCGVFSRIEADGSISFSMTRHSSGTYAVPGFSSAAGVLSPGQWHKLAYVFTAGFGAEIFVDGASVGWGPIGSSHYSGNPQRTLNFGSWQALTTTDFSGFFDEIRVTKAARYPIGYTPSIGPLTDIEYDPEEDLLLRTEVDPDWPSVVSLLKFDGTDTQKVFYDAAIKDNWDYSGSGVELDDAQLKYGATSGLFAGGHLSRDASRHHQIVGAGAVFTVEAWIRPTAGDSMIVAASGTTTLNWSSGNLQWLFYINSSNVVEFQFTKGTAGVVLSGGSISMAGVWQHVAVTCDGSDVKGFIDGAQIFSGTAALMASTSDRPLAEIGRFWGDGRTFSGHIDDLRITKGVARYTGAFTPPASLPTSRYVY